jgi:ATP-dependent helicase/nuclease subunit A
MSGVRTIPDVVRQRQTEASDPDVSAFVAANAGSGKTHVLAQRVIRLLLDGVDPAKILCITFTKAAAANMANRVFERLKTWTALDDVALDQAMRDIGIGHIDAARRARARRLFAETLETPGGLKVQTIHAFCTRLLHQFPFEANVAARFTVLDDRTQHDLLDRATLSILLEAAARPDSTIGRALAAAMTAAADTTFRDVVREAIARHDDILRWIAAAGGIDAAIAELARTLGIDPADTLTQVETDMVDGPILPPSEWPAVAALCGASTASDQNQCARLTRAAAASGAERVEAYQSVFVTAQLEQRKSIITAALAKKYPDLAQRLADEQNRILDLLNRRRAVLCRDRTGALLTVAADVLARYRRDKDRRGMLDYDDLIDKALAMLSSVNPSWVHYKLDLGIDHLLIDEAQDTSPKQWAVISRLVAEFAAGAGARTSKRTIFAVGDEKQSIFSFQGAVPREFDAMRRTFAAAFAPPELGWRYVRFLHSFRSGANVLGAVDRVFSDEEIYVSVTPDDAGVPPHEALPGTPPGLVEIWEPIKADEKREIEGWEAPFDALAETSPQVRLAQQIAATIRAWTARGIRAGDVLILVRQRGPLFETIIRALKDMGIAVAGADRLKLTEHIAIVDLMALADALLLPDDDLSLAIALKSPLFGLNDDQLFALARNRPGTLRAALHARAGDDLAFAAAAARLDRCATAARSQTPFSFYAWLIGPDGGRAAMLARLGSEAADALDEFLELALDYERREAPSLQGFLAWLRAAEVEIKRDMDIARDEVRVMTVHGAKGLEAPNVILADTMTPPAGAYPPRLLALPAAEAAPGTPDRIVWAGARATDVAPVAAARDRALIAAEDEYRRLLYVAMTRAANRLVVCGAEGVRRRPKACWYDLVRDALAPDLVEEPADAGDGTVLRYRRIAAATTEAAAPPRERAEHAIDLPRWLNSAIVAAPAQARAITPSAAHDGTATRALGIAGSGEGLAAALARGQLIHRLMQSLPDIVPERRAEAGERYLARAGAMFSAAERDRFLAEVLAVLADRRFAPLFAPGSRAEVPIVGRISRGARPSLAVSGQVDRLIVTPDAALIADYKTNQPAPRRPQDVPPAYVTQLALYRAVLTKLYRDRPVRAALVWTDVPDLLELSPQVLDGALAHLTSA